MAVEKNGVWGKALEVPGLAALNTGRVRPSRSVSCASARTCAVGGYHADANDDFHGFEAGHRVRYLTAADLVETSTEPWPTTPSAGSSKTCSATT